MMVSLNFSVECWSFNTDEAECVWLEPGSIDAQGKISDEFVTQLNYRLSPIRDISVLHRGAVQFKQGTDGNVRRPPEKGSCCKSTAESNGSS